MRHAPHPHPCHTHFFFLYEVSLFFSGIGVCFGVFYFLTSKASTGLCRLLDCLSVLCYTVPFLSQAKVLTVSVGSIFNLDFVPFILYLAPRECS